MNEEDITKQIKGAFERAKEERKMNEQDIINEYAYDLDRYETYEDLVSALRGDERFKYEDGDAYYLDLATQIISKADCIACDRCSRIVYCDDAFCIDYADTDETIRVVETLRGEEDGENMSILCPVCYNELKMKGEK